MISVAEAEELLKAHPLHRQEATMPLTQALGHRLAEDLVADRDFPPFDRVTMDGIGIDHSSFQGVDHYELGGTAAAGTPQMELRSPDQCLEVMTGAICPKGVSAVIRYEDLEITQKVARVHLKSIAPGMNIHPQGSDRKRGEIIVPAGQIIGPAELGIAATVGKSQLLVEEIPEVLIISTGDELVAIEDKPLPYQIRSSNASMIAAALQSKTGCKTTHLHIADDKTATQQTLENALQDFAVIVLLGGSSKGKFDFVPSTLESLGVQRHFYKVAQRPGKPFWFGSIADSNFVFALPGNPVSCFMCLTRYVIPWMQDLVGEPGPMAVLHESVDFKPPLTYFLQVKLQPDGSTTRAMSMHGRGSGDLANLCHADAFLQLPDNRSSFSAGEAFPYFSYR